MIERKEYKKLFVEVSPAFYKNMLFNAINKKEKIMVAYQEDPSRPFRDSDFLKGDKEFEYINMTGSPWKMPFQCCLPDRSARKGAGIRCLALREPARPGCRGG